MLVLPGCGFQSKIKLFRGAFDAAGEGINNDLEKHVPADVTPVLNVHYNESDTDAFLDVYYPVNDTGWNNRPVIVWIHGGGWIAGSKEQIANYAKIVAHKGYTVITVEYSLAPERKHPTPVRQVNTALAFLLKHAAKYHVNAKQIVIAGDSGGAQIAAQLGIVLSDPAYAKRLGIIPSVSRSAISGMILHCGIYNLSKAEKGKEGVMLRMMMRAYSGHKIYKPNSYFGLGSVVHHIPENYPPTFISVGNKDILKEHSYELAKELINKGIPVDTLFFETADVSLNHEYQFNLDDESGKVALEKTLTFLNTL